jgi:ABC-type amino acid transport substrate-binding protein
MILRLSLLVLPLLLPNAGDVAWGQETLLPARVLQIGTRVAPPFAISSEGGWEGISIDLLAEVAAEIGVTAIDRSSRPAATSSI